MIRPLLFLATRFGADQLDQANCIYRQNLFLHRCITGSNTEVVEKRTLGNILAIHPGKSIGVSKKLDGFGVSAKVFRNIMNRIKTAFTTSSAFLAKC